MERMPIWILHSFIANAVIMGIEYIYRTKAFPDFTSALPYMLIPILIAQYSLFYLFREAPSYLLGWAVFFLGNGVLRVAISIYLGEPMSEQIIGGLLLIGAGAFFMKI